MIKVKNIYTKSLLFAIIIFGVGTSILNAQQKTYTSKEALKIFNSGNYIEAEEAYSYLLNQTPRDASYNFYMGICQLNNKSDISGAIKKLNYARVKKVSRNVYYYLGKAQRANFRFDEAIRNFSMYLKYASKSDKRVEETKNLIEECRTAQRLSAKIYELSVLDKSISHKDSILELYYPSPDVGSVMLNQEFFDSGVKPNVTLFLTERKDIVYFTSESATDSLDIFKMEKLIDGWGSKTDLKNPVNTEFNDAYPFIETDGVTLYFASDRPGGFGGYDIYKTYFDVETQSYVEPINLGVPFNSSEDDFLFVADEFNGVAWFASNRETNGDDVMVYSVKWDGSQVRNMAQDANQISVAGQLLLAGEQEENSNVGFTYSEKKKRVSVKAEFEFAINDTLTYLNFEDFLSDEALALFRESYKKQLEKDELSALMTAKRKEYAVTNSAEEQNALVNEIIKLETEVYNIDDFIKEQNIKVRYIELQEIKKQISNGTYQPNSSSQPSGSVEEALTVPAKYNYLVSDEFEQQALKLNDMYVSLFSASDIEELKMADSLYVWASLLHMEASNILEESASAEEERTIQVSNILKKDAVQETSESGELMQESKFLATLSTKLYHKSFDKKYPIYWLKLNGIIEKEGNSQAEVVGLASKGNAYFNEANNILSKAGGVTIEEYQKVAAIKKAGVESQEKALITYAQNNSKVIEQQEEPKGSIQKSYSELQKGDEAIQKAQVVKDKPLVDKGEYRIQIGVFRNSPNADSLAKIPPITTLEIEGKDLTKYMAGHYNSIEEATNAIESIEAAGFNGAYVVFVKDGVVSKP